MARPRKKKQTDRQNVKRAREALERKKKDEEQNRRGADVAYPSTSATLSTPPPLPPLDSVPSAKKRRLIMTGDHSESITGKDKEYVILEKSYLENVMTKVSCGICYGNVKINFVQNELDCKLDVLCENCESISDSTVTETPVTKAFVYGCMENGVGYAVLDYNVGYAEGNVYTELVCVTSKIRMSHLQMKDKRRERVLEKTAKKRKVEDTGDYAAGGF